MPNLIHIYISHYLYVFLSVQKSFIFTAHFHFGDIEKRKRRKLKYFWISFVFFRKDHMKLGSLIHCCLLHWVYITGYYRVIHVSHFFHISHYRRVCLFINFGHNKIGFYLFCSWHSNKVQKPLRHMQRSSGRGTWEEHRRKRGGGA